MASAIKLHLLGFMCTVAAFPQVPTPLKVYQSAGSISGEIWLQEPRSGGQNWWQLSVPVLAGDKAFVAPAALPLTNGECLKATTAGVLSFAACDSLWTASGGDISRLTGNVTVAGTITSNQSLTVSTTGNANFQASGGAFGDAGLNLSSNSGGKQWQVKSGGTTGDFTIRDVTSAVDRITVTSATGVTIFSLNATPPAPLSGTVLQVVQANGSGGRILIDSFAALPAFTARRANGTSAAPSALGAGDQILAFLGFGYGATGYSASGITNIRGIAAATWTDTSMPGYLTFETTPSASVTAVERMRIDSAGTVTIGGTLAANGGISTSVTDEDDIGSVVRFRNIYGKAVNTASLEVANDIFVTSFWRHALTSASQYSLYSGSGAQSELNISAISSTNTQWGFRGTLYPLATTGSNGDLGYAGTPWRTQYLSTSAFMSGTQWMDSSRNLTNLGTISSGGITASAAITANGGISTGAATNSTIYTGTGNFYLRTFTGADAGCTGVTNGWVGYRLDTNEIQMCNGGVMKKVALT